MTGYAALHAGLIARQVAPRHRPPPPSAELLRALEEDDYDGPEHQLDRDGGELAPSASVSANLITAGRLQYRAERERLARKGPDRSSEGVCFGRSQRHTREVDMRSASSAKRGTTSMIMVESGSSSADARSQASANTSALPSSRAASAHSPQVFPTTVASSGYKDYLKKKLSRAVPLILALHWRFGPGMRGVRTRLFLMLR